MVNGNRVELTLDMIYPVGSIYMSMNSTNPSELFGGTWEQIQDRFLLAASSSYSAGSTGGSLSHNHTLDSGYAKISFEWDSANSKNLIIQDVTWSGPTIVHSYTMGGLPGFYHEEDRYSNASTKLGGTSDSANVLPPYLAFYMWKRTA